MIEIIEVLDRKCGKVGEVWHTTVTVAVQMKELCRLWEPQFFSNITKPWESIDDLPEDEVNWFSQKL